MKLERLPEYITIVITIACGMCLALYVGVAAGTGSNTPLMLIGGALIIMFALILRANIWMLIPICGPLSGKISGVPGDFSVGQLAIFYAFAVFLTLKALKVVRSKPIYNWIDYLLWINLAYLLTAYIRNPVGTLGMGFEKIGGKPYVEVLIGLLAYWVLNRVTISPKLATRMPLLMILGALFNTFAGAVGMFIPSIGELLTPLYSGFAPAPLVVQDAPTDGKGIDRENCWVGGGTSLLKAFCSYFSPLSLLNPLNIVRFLSTILVFVVVMKSGFRSVFLSTLFFFAFAAYFRKGMASAMRIPALVIPLLLFILIGHGTFFELPLNIQRTLSFLPGKWDPVAQGDAEGSTEWRHEIWANVWNSGDKYIKNWWLGDGFGMTRSELREAGQMGADSQENLTVAGDYHSLPLSTIHVVGYVGLALLLIQMGGMSFYAWMLINRARGTPYFPLALFMGVPVVYEIILGMFVFGAYNGTAPANIYTVAWLRLISRSLDAYLNTTKEAPVESAAVFPELEFPRFPRPSAS